MHFLGCSDTDSANWANILSGTGWFGNGRYCIDRRSLLCSSPKNMKQSVLISIDKDVLDERYAMTNWNQGDMSLGMLEDVLAHFLKNCEVIGIDICGDDPDIDDYPTYIKAERINNLSDDALYQTAMKILKRRQKK